MLIEKIKQDLKSAQLNRDEVKVSTLRLLLSEVNNLKIALRQSSGFTPRAHPEGQAGIANEDVISIIQREIKKRKEAAAGFRSGGRENQAQKEETESKVLEDYLPKQLTNEELTKIVEDSITEVGATSLVDMGKVMGMVMANVAGRADGGTVSAMVKQILGRSN